MRKSILLSVGLLAAMVFLPRLDARADTGGTWLHVRVEEAKKPTKVSVNLPMGVVEAALKASPKLVEEQGKVHLGGEHGMKLADLRKVWQQVAAVGDAEFVTVESDEQDVRVQRKGEVVQILVGQKPGRAAGKAEAAKAPAKGPAEVRVELPVALVDALLSGEGEELNVQAAVAALQKRRGDIVRVHDADSHVRVWVDDQNTQAAKESAW